MRSTADVTNMPRKEPIHTGKSEAKESALSAMSWPAILGGAAAAVAVSLILLLLGSGLGLAVSSPWALEGISSTSLAVMGVIWIFAMQAISSGLGGYLAGRLRAKWVGIHNEEVLFRDTAHGFLSWVVATIFTVGFVASATTSIVSSGLTAATTVAAATAAGTSQAVGQNMGLSVTDPTAYLVDSLFRTDRPVGDMSMDAIRTETARIFMNDMAKGEFPSDDRAYLAQLVSAQTGLPAAEASERVDNIIAQATTAKETARQRMDDTRQATARFSLFAFLSLVVGAFIACMAARAGGKHRDAY